MNDEEKYKNLRASLKSLPKVKARTGFEDRLFQRIKQLEQGEVQQVVKPVPESKFKGWFANLFRPSFAPAMGLTVVLLVGIVVYFAYYSQLNKEQSAPNQYSVTSNSDQKPGFVIYVKRDTSNYSSNYPHEYSGLTPGETESSNSEFKQDAPKVSSDFNSTTPSPSVDDKIHDDRISNEQRIEMQRSTDIESKSETIPEGKTDRKKDGYLKSEDRKVEKKAPSNYYRENEENKEKNNTSKGDDGTINQQNAPVKTQDEIDSGKDNDNDSINDKSGRGLPDKKKDSKKLSKSQLDSLKAKEKAPLIEEPDSTKK